MAVLHHISTHERRVHALEELIRIVKPGGAILVQVWSLSGDKEREDGGQGGEGKGAEEKESLPGSATDSDVLVPWHLHDRFAPAVLPAGGVRDEDRGTTVFQRYCHSFTSEELRDLCDALPLCNVDISHEADHLGSNWTITANKPMI